MAKNQFIDKNILIISEDEKSFIFYMEFFLKELKFQNNNSDLKKHFPKSKKQRYFIKFENFERIIIALICPKNQSPQDIVNLAKKLKDEEKNNKIPKFDKIFCVFDATSPQENRGNNEIYKKIIAPQNLKVLNEKYQNEIEIIDSNPSYEIWILNHFQNFSDKQFKNSKLAEDEINKILKIKTKNKNFFYEKNNEDWFEKIINEKNINQAIKNCQALENHHSKHQTKNPNPSSKIYKILDFIKKISEKK
jgi:hypothetical protein